MIDIRVAIFQLRSQNSSYNLDVERQALDVKPVGRVAERDPDTALGEASLDTGGHAQEGGRATAGDGVGGALVEDDVEGPARRQVAVELRGVGDDVGEFGLAKRDLLQPASALDSQRLVVDVSHVQVPAPAEMVLQVARAGAQLKDPGLRPATGQVRRYDSHERLRRRQPLVGHLRFEAFAPVALFLKIDGHRDFRKRLLLSTSRIPT